ncbi:PIN domain-containing protein [Cryobacterium luteum]|uniref:Ribonuclease VapC n=1 Tax=Cryobacterium luteum TaxID=1424661 RepID=A0A1H8FE57_9MICO|nr:PIN domain-containing protein [Cryobacterium luteum]TFB93338.1 type II toxin-antitoxin system VapC family toxin [Cryobacterium luteum]SEN29850.1 Predicted nucleic acid-binding protein, contains PIN domain [Cryobacterium luteum]
MSASLDANVVLRLLLNDVPKQHDAAVALLQAGGTFVVSDIALVETVFVLGRAYGLTREQQREAIHGLVILPQIVANASLFDRALALYVKHPKLSFEDCYLVTSADMTANQPLYTFDRKLASQTDAHLLVTA